MKLISVLVPCYNESESIMELYSRVKHAFKGVDYDYEIIYIDNVSTDNSISVYRDVIKDPRVKVLLMSRNFGTNQPSYFAGIHYAKGDAVILVDGDLQDPPELIPEFLKKWESGFDVVYGVRVKRKGSLVRRICYKLFYRIFKWLSYIDIPLDSGDFSLIDRKVVDVIKSMPEKDIYIRGLRAWAGFKQTGINYTRQERPFGKTSIPFFVNFSWAKKAIINFSYKPLEFISRLALVFSLLTFLAAIGYSTLYFNGNTPRGFLTLLMVMFIFGTIQLLALSIIAEYLIRIFHEVKARPPYVIKEVLESKSDSLYKEAGYEDFKEL